MVLILTILIYCLGNRTTPTPNLQTVNSESSARFELQSRIFGLKQTESQEPVILMAASGGGTRAALYTASVLHGLANLEQLKNVSLLSGVSGGSLGIAYFAANRKALLNSDSREAWQEYYVKMSMPYIEDVFEGAAEWRILREERLGKLLSESFENRLFSANPSANLGSNEIGLIFNTATCWTFAI